MRKLILASVVLATATPVLAQSGTTTGTVTIDGSVAPRCLFTTSNAVINAGELAQGGTGAGAGKLDASKLDGQSRTLVGWCNGTASSMSVEAFPVVNTTVTSAPPAGFDRVVNYTATATANSVNATDSSIVAGAGSAVHRQRHRDAFERVDSRLRPADRRCLPGRDARHPRGGELTRRNQGA
jgi:hypothetical protein